MVKKYKRNRPTIGVLAGWQWYEGVALHRYLEPVFYGMHTAAQDLGCNVLTACGVGEAALNFKDQAPPVRPAWPALLPGVDFVPVGPWNTDGLIVVTPLLSEDRSRYMKELIAGGHPTVFINGWEKGSAVMADSDVGIQEALAHLAQHGHRRIVFLAGYIGEDGEYSSRLKSYLSGMRQCQLEADPALIVDGGYNQFAGYRAVRKFLERGVPFTALLAANDELAFGAMTALKEAGRRIPRDVAVIGFDNRLDAITQSPPLTSIHNPSFEGGYQAVDLLLKLINGQATETVIYLPTRLVIRESCGCEPGRQVRNDPRLSASRDLRESESASIASQLVTTMSEAVLAESTLAEGRRLKVDEVRELCERLWQTLLMALAEGDSMRFESVLVAVLGRTAAVGDDIFGWQAAISVLERHIPVFLPVDPSAARRQQEEYLRQAEQVAARRKAEEWLRQAHLLIGREMQQQHIRYRVQRESIADLSGLLLARLLTARDEGEIFKILAGSLPALGLERVRVALFEPEADDPVACSRLRTLTGEQESCFPSREFPPSELYPDEPTFHLALLPLVIPEVGSGFVAFDVSDTRRGTANLDLCAVLVQQLAAALGSAHLRLAEREQARQLEQAYRALQDNQQKLLVAEKMASLGRLTAGIAHEMNTPLAAIRVSLKDLSRLTQEYESSIGDPQITREDYAEITREMLHAIQLAEKSAEQAVGFVRNIKSQTRDPAPQEQRSFNAVPVIQETLQFLGYELRHANCTVTFETTKPEVELYGSPGRFTQMVTNLLTNALEASRPGGPITLRLAPDPQGIELKVSDQGRGIAPENLSRIFDPLFTTKPFGESTGLGLTIVHDIVTSEFNGTIEAESELGQGTTFTLRFPLPLEIAYGS